MVRRVRHVRTVLGMFRLTVKGDKGEASRSAAAAGVPFVFVKERRTMDGHETIGHSASDTNVKRSRVFAWYDAKSSVLLEYALID